METIDITGLSEAAKALLDKAVMGTDLSSAELRELDAALRAQKFFSARMIDTRMTERLRDLVANMIEPDRLKEYTPTGPDDTFGSRPAYNEAYAREEFRNFLKNIGYQPAAETAGTLQDFSSTARIQIILQTNTDLARGMGGWIQGQRPAILDEWPGQELFRAESRAKIRDWLARWRLAGAQTGDPIGTGWTITPDERLIALKNHDIWNWIGSSDLFDDALDVLWPPFAFNSGMWVRDVFRNECEALGLLDPDAPAPAPMNIVDALKAFTAKISALAA